MFRPRHWLTVLAVLALAVGCGGDKDDSTKQSASIQQLPPISQPGASPEPAGAALTPVTGRFEPATEGRPVTLERREGDKWVAVEDGKLDAEGTVRFLVPGAVDREPATYRITAAAADGHGELSTDSTSVEQWGKPALNDEFTGSELTDLWFHRGTDYNPDGARRCSRGAAEAARVTRGVLELSVLLDRTRSEQCLAKRNNGEPLGRFGYRLNGHIGSVPDHPLLYGVAAARLKFPKQPGQHASFWLQSLIVPPDASSATEAGAEIDIIEWFGVGDKGESRLASFIYHLSPDGSVKTGGLLKNPDDFLTDKADSWFEDYHVFAVEWTPKEYVFYVDGRETWRTSEGVSAQPEMMVLSLLSSDYELPNSETLPATMSVDWVRYWKLPE